MIVGKLFDLLAINVPNGCQRDFLGLHPWYYYLPSGDFFTSAEAIVDPAKKCDIKNFDILPVGGHSDVALVMAAVLDDLLRIAGLVAIAFVIVGAIQFITSQGDPEGTARAQSTVINALIGLAITVVAVAFVSFVGNSLGR